MLFNLFLFFDFFFIVHCLYILNFVISSPRRLLAMICILLNYAFFLILLKLEYLAFIIVIIYVGAVSVIFLFIIMLVNVLQTVFYYRENGFLMFWFVGLFFFFLIFLGFFGVLGCDTLFEYSFVYFYKESSNFFFFENPRFFIFNVLDQRVFFYLNNFELFNFVFFDIINYNMHPLLEVEQLGFLLWTKYVIFVIVCGLILVFSIIGGISILKSIFLLTVEKKELLKKEVSGSVN